MRASIPSAESVSDTADYRSLRELEVALQDGGYRVLVISSAVCMRGVDYLGKERGLTLIIDAPFDSLRDAHQGLARVGRFGEKCRRL